MLDEWMEQKVDEACEVVPAYVNPRKIRLASSHIGWRLYLYGSSLKRAVSGFFVHIRSEQDMDIFLREKARLLAVLDDAGMRLRFATTLYLFGLAALGTLAVGGREMALCALAACLMLLSAAMELGYEPICAGIRQRYLFSVGLRTLALTVPLADYFGKYLMAGVASNVVLQSLMIVMLGVHLALFFALICFNRRQSPMLRALSGVLGVFPALTASAAAALAVANLAQPVGIAAAAMLRALGATGMFLGDRLMAANALGGIRLKYESVWEWLLLCGGLTLMTVGAWLTAAPM